MSLTLYYHPLSSFCWKVLIALYENDTPFMPVMVNLMDSQERASFLKIWPIGKFPVVVDGARSQTVPESSVIIEYLSRHYPGRTALIPAAHPLGMRKWDRIIDLHLHMQMQKIVGDRLRPDGAHDPHGVDQAKATVKTTLTLIEEQIVGKPWIMGDDFTMADCAAAPALFYADKVVPFGASHPQAMAYLERLKSRPSFARVLKEAEPFFKMFPA